MAKSGGLKLALCEIRRMSKRRGFIASRQRIMQQKQSFCESKALKKQTVIKLLLLCNVRCTLSFRDMFICTEEVEEMRYNILAKEDGRLEI